MALLDWLKKQAKKSATSSKGQSNKKTTSSNKSSGTSSSRRTSSSSSSSSKSSSKSSSSSSAKKKAEEEARKRAEEEARRKAELEKKKKAAKKTQENLLKNTKATQEKQKKRGGVVLSDKTVARKQAAKKAQDNLKKTLENTKESAKKTTNKDEVKKAVEKSQQRTALGTKKERITESVKVDNEDGKKTKGHAKVRTYSYEQLSAEEANKMAVAAQQGRLDEMLKADKKLAKKVGELNVKDYAKSPAVMGALDQLTMGRSVSDNPVYNYSDTGNAIMKQQKQTGAYNVGRAVGAIGEFALGGTGTLGTAFSEGVLKAAGKEALKGAAKQGGKQLAKQTAKDTAKDVVGDFVASFGLNALDAVKFSYKDGEFDGKTFAKELAWNLGGDVAFGSVISGVMRGVPAAKISRFTKITEKLNADKTLTKSEMDFYKKNYKQLADTFMDKVDELKANRADTTVEAEQPTVKTEAEPRTETAKSTEPSKMTEQQEKARLQAIIENSRNNDEIADATRRLDEINNKEAQIKALTEEKKRAELVIGNSHNANEIETAMRRVDEIDSEIEKLNAKTSDVTAPRTEEPTVSKTESVEQPTVRTEQTDVDTQATDGIARQTEEISEENANILTRLTDQKAYAERQLYDLQARGENTEQLERAIASYDSQISQVPVSQEVKNNYIEQANIKQEQSDVTFRVKQELAPLQKELKELNYKALNTEDPNRHIEYVTRRNEVADRIEDLKEQIAVKNPETDEDWDILTKHAEKETYKDLPDKPVTAKQSDYDKTVAKITGRKKVDVKAESPLGKLRRLFVDDFAAFETFAKKKLKGEEQESFLALINNLRLAENRAGAWLNEARTTLDRKLIEGGKSLKEILGDYTSKANAEKYALFNDYLYHTHNIARASGEKPVFGEEISSMQSERIANEILEQYPEFADKQREIVEYFRDLQQVRVDAGLISEDTAKMFDKMYENYVPTYRVQEGKAFNSAHVKYSVKNGVNVATGSNKDLLYIHEQAAMVTERTFKDAEANMMLQAYSKYGGFDLEAIGKQYDPEEIIQSGTYLNDDKTVTFWENGEAKKVSITDEMYEGLSSWSGLDKSEIMNWKLTKTTGKLNRAFKHLITDWNPLFAVTNGAKDFQDAILLSKDTKAFVKSYPKAVKAIMQKDEYYKLYVANGGKYSSFFDVTANFRADTIIDKANPLKWIETLNTTIEMMPRMMEFIATVDKGLKGADVSSAGKNLVDKAMYNANDITLNFGRSGKLSRAMNQTIVPYFNPSIQGFDKLYRTFTDNGVKGFIHMGIKTSGLFVPPMVLNEVMNYYAEGYEDLNTRDKDLYYLIPLGDKRWIKIPKSRMASTLTSSVQHLLNRALYQTPYDIEGLFKLMLNNSAPINPFSNNLLSPIFNVKNNRTWWGGEIEYSSDEKLPINERYDENTSAISIWLGQSKVAQKLNLSPKKINTIIDGYTGVVGDFILPWTANAARTNPVVNKFVLDGVFSNSLSTAFWDKNSQLYMKMNSKNATEKDIERYNEFGALYSKDSASINQAISDIQNSKLSKKEKAEKVRELRKLLNSIYKAGSTGVKHTVNVVKSIAKQVGYHKALSNYSNNTGRDAYEQYTAIEGLDGLNKKQREQKAKAFYQAYNQIEKINNRFDWTKKGYPDYDTIALGCVFAEASDSIYEAYNINENTRSVVSRYVEVAKAVKNETNKQIANRFVVTTKVLDKGLEKFEDTSAAIKAMIFATDKSISVDFADIAYYVKKCESKMNAARGLSQHGWKTKQIAKLRSELDGSTKTSDIKALVNKQNCSSEEKALLFEILAPRNRKNPFGSTGDYSIKRDYGIYEHESSGYSGGYSSGGSRSRRGGSSEPSAKKNNLPSWEDYIKDYISNIEDVAGVKFDKWDSPLDKTYQNKINSILKKMEVKQ